MNPINFDDHPVLSAYCLSVYHRYKTSGGTIHTSKNKYNKRTYEHVQELENNRTRLHEECIRILKEEGYNLKDATKLLENHIEYLINKKMPPLKEGENYCGLCRCKVKTAKWDEHAKSAVHDRIAKDVEGLYLAGYMAENEERLKRFLEDMKKKRGNKK